MRRACTRRGHRWGSFAGGPWEFCARWRCDASRVDPVWAAVLEVSNPFLLQVLTEVSNEHITREEIQ